jgi:hypothetical protein
MHMTALHATTAHADLVTAVTRSSRSSAIAVSVPEQFRPDEVDELLVDWLATLSD